MAISPWNERMGEGTAPPPAPIPPAERPEPARGGLSWTHLQLISFLLSIAFALTLFIGVILFFLVSLDIPDLSSIGKYNPPVTSFLLDGDGNIAERVYSQNRIVIPLSQMPPLLPKAFIAAEDGRFYQHGGIDAWSILRALIHNVIAGDREQGGSTITQQMARALLLNREKTYKRKIREAILAYRIDKMLSKDEILYIYLNEIYLGEGAYGVEAAARTYFGKTAAELGLAEIAILAGLPQAPSRYSPFKHFPMARKRQAYVLNRMAEEGFVTSEVARRAYNQPLLWAPAEEDRGDSRYFLEEVKKYVIERHGHDALYGGGLIVSTSLDAALQQEALLAVGKGLTQWEGRHKKKALQELPESALVAIDLENGQVKAIAGGRDFDKSQFNRAVQAKRQPGSAFKPFLYAAAFAQGHSPASVIEDSPFFLKGARPGEVWQPKNFGGEYYGPTTLRDALIYSRNVVSVKLLQELGVNSLIQFVRNCGITSKLTPNLSLALGASEVTLLELTAAYGAFARGGLYRSPIMVTKIVSRGGKVLEEEKTTLKRVMDERIAGQITDLLSKVITEGTGKAARGLGMAAAGKTGTTDNSMDAWFIGYTPRLVTGVWMGFDKKESLGSKETGGQACAPLWRDFMERAVAYRTEKQFALPEGMVAAVERRLGGSTGDETMDWETVTEDSATEPQTAPAPPGVEPKGRPAPSAVVDPLDVVRRWLRGEGKADR